jgi:methionyl-tRNA formyltransferase
MRLIFAGTPDFAAIALQALIARGHEIALVLTQPDRPAGRGLKLSHSPVKTLAVAHGLPVHQPLRLKSPEEQAPVAACSAELMIVAAYGLLLPQAVLDLPALGCLNIHASLLPRWRGAAPIQRAIEAGDARTGVAIMQMDVGLDTGPVRAQQAIDILPAETAGALQDRLARLGADLLCRVIDDLPAHPPQPQALAGATYARKIDKLEARLDLQQPAQLLARKIRAFNPAPGCTLEHPERVLKIWSAQAVSGNLAPGAWRVTPAGLEVGTGAGHLRLDEVQKPGGRRQSGASLAAEWLSLGEASSAP